MVLVAAQALGIVAADAGWIGSRAALWLGLASVALGIAARRRRGFAAALAVVAIACSGAAALAARLEGAARARPRAPVEVSLDATVVAVTRGRDGADVDLAEVVAAPGETRPVPGRIRLRERTARETAIGSLLPGDRVRLRARLRAPEHRANPGGQDRSAELARRGVGAIGTALHPDLVVRLVDREGWRPLAAVHAFRAAAAQRLRREGEGGALLAALALGERGGLDAARRDAFRRLGLSHLLSVSGLHLVLVAALGYAIARGVLRLAPIGDRRRAALASAILAATGYAILAGFGIPVRRALVLLLAIAASVWMRRPVQRGAPLAVAALAILALDPAALFDAGAQMSFLASGALIFGMQRAAQRTAGEKSRLWRHIVDLLDTSALATAATAPIAAAAIGSVSPWGLLANLVAVPWTGFLLMPTALIAGVLAGIAGAHRFSDVALDAMRAIAALSLGALAIGARIAPAPWLSQPAPFFVGMALAALFFVVRATTPWRRIAAALAIVALLALAPAAAIRPLPPRVVVLDVGQGDAVLVQGRTGALLVDAGVALPDGVDLGRSVVVPALRALGVDRLDLLVASHADLDHRGGLPSVLEALPVARLWLPRGALEEPAFAGTIATARAAGTVVEEQGAGGAALEAGDLHVEPLWPASEAGAASRNDRSLTLRVHVAGRTVLLPGDLEAAAERRLLDSGATLHADVLKLAHHGSRTSSSAAWLAAVDGAVAVASAPHFGRFGMPHAEVVARVRAAGYALWWTGRDGAVLVGLGPILHVWGWRRATPARWSRSEAGVD